MKRFLICVVIAVCVFSAIRSARVVRHSARAEHHERAVWPNAPLAPRSEVEPQRGKASRLRFAAANGEVRITANGQDGVTVVVDQVQGVEDEVSGSPLPEANAMVAGRSGTATWVASDLKFTAARAQSDLKIKIKETISKWLGDEGIPADWAPPDRLVSAAQRGPQSIQTVEREYGDDQRMYVAGVALDLGPANKERFVQEYNRHLAGQRLSMLGGGLAFVLACLGIGVGYVRTDEATKGYYTGRLRLMAAAGVGAAAVLLFQWIARVV